MARNMVSSDFLNIDDALDCDSIRQKLAELEVAKTYPTDILADIDAKISTLQSRAAELGC